MNTQTIAMQYDAGRQSVGVAFALWFFMGTLAAHRFYLGMPETGAILLVVNLIAIMLTLAGNIAGLLMIIVSCTIILVDAFRIPGWVRRHNTALANRLSGAPPPPLPTKPRW